MQYVIYVIAGLGADREIGEKLNLPRRTVNHRRQRAYELLKKLMGGDADA